MARKFLGLLVGVALTLSAGYAQAVPFATFSDQKSTSSIVVKNLPTGGTGTYTNHATGTVSSDPVNFNYIGIAGLPAALSGTQDALLSYTWTTTAAASAAGGIDSMDVNQAVTITFTRATPYVPTSGPQHGQNLSNLLTVVLTTKGAGTKTAVVYGLDRTQSVHMDSDSTMSTVTFTSDFLDFSNTAEHSMEIGYTLATNRYLGIGKKFLTSFNSNNVNQHGYTATQAGTFGSTPPPKYVVAEPDAFLVLGIGGVMVGAVASRRRRLAR